VASLSTCKAENGPAPGPRLKVRVVGMLSIELMADRRRLLPKNMQNHVGIASPRWRP
jgi:GMP synthase PP-ATPase subunit